MYAGFELKEMDKFFFYGKFDYYLNTGNESFYNHKIKVEKTLNSFINSNGSLNGDKMQSAWFPNINADVFLSHSHKDKDLVIAFAGWLTVELKLKVFIDSCIWEYSLDLQKLLDDEYNKINDNLYKYQSVLYASSHVHMMLNTALMKMIDNCECVIFVNTPNSIKPGEVIDKVVSPWIYSEIGMTKLIRKKSLTEHRLKGLFESTKSFSDLEIEYNLDTDHLIKLSKEDLRTWSNAYLRVKDYQSFVNEKHPLDNLYELKEYT